MESAGALRVEARWAAVTSCFPYDCGVMLGVVVEDRGRFTLVRVSGEVDMATAPTLRQEFVRLVGEGRVDLVVDLAAVDFIDSTGLGILIGGLKRARSQGGDLRVCTPTGQVAEVFSLTGLAGVLRPIDADELERAGRTVDQT